MDDNNEIERLLMGDLESGFERIVLQEYTDEEVRVFLKCIMSQNISAEDVLKCLAAIGVNLQLDHELYQMSETTQEGELEEFTSSDFQEFVNESVDFLLYEKDYLGWLRWFRDKLIELENYELLQELQIEREWNI